MSTDHVVAPTGECAHDPDGTALDCAFDLAHGDACLGCLGDGRRALLDQAVPVVLQGVSLKHGQMVWREVES